MARHLAAQAAKIHPLDGGPDDNQNGARMNEAVVLTPERILEVTEDVLRRFGLAKATVVDVARALDVSHGSVYRHFPSKASLREAVAKRWLDRVNAPLEKIAEGAGPAPARLERWLRALCSVKQKKVCDDPEMFATYLTLAREALRGREGAQGTVWSIRSRIFSPTASSRAPSRSPTSRPRRARYSMPPCRYHHPAHAEEWNDPALAARIDALLALLLKGSRGPAQAVAFRR